MWLRARSRYQSSSTATTTITTSVTSRSVAPTVITSPSRSFRFRAGQQAVFTITRNPTRQPLTLAASGTLLARVQCPIRQTYRTSIIYDSPSNRARTTRTMATTAPPSSSTPAATTGRTYNDAIDTLNTFQTPYHIIEQRRKAGIRPDADSIKEMQVYLARIGYSTDDLARLNILHVAGTKGKGSTCAFADSILTRCLIPYTPSSFPSDAPKRRPLKAGLFTSPHLVAVRERIRINSIPISEPLFAKYFFEVYNLLLSSPCSTPSTQAPPAAGTTPIYARFLTLLSYHIFLREKVDVAIYETGIGGEYDATNIVTRPVATAITTLAIDHVYMLGDTVGKIAWHKGGIMKAGARAFTIPQVEEAGKVLEERAREKGVALETLEVDGRLWGVGVRPDQGFQKRNATLGIALAETVLQKLDPEFKPDKGKLPSEFVEGLEKVVWRGRCEVMEEAGGKVLWHLDGAHTVDSLKMAARWFAGECRENKRKGPKVLVFNQQGREEAVGFLRGVYEGVGDEGFDEVVFCTNVTFAGGYKRDFVNHQHDPEAIKKLSLQHTFAEKWRGLDPNGKIEVLPTIEEAINHVRGLHYGLREGEVVQAFITGSLHLVGGALGVFEGKDSL